jgi:hypothetical protein
MTPPPATTREHLVELIVAEVMRTLDGKADARDTKLPQKKSTNSVSTAGELRLDDAVVAVGQLEGRLSGVGKLMVRQRAVVTPAARDLLRQAGVALVRTAEATPAAAAVELLLGVAETNFNPASLVERARGDGMVIERIAQTGLPQVVRELTEEIHKGGRRGMLLTSFGPASVILANRHRGVRACDVRTAADLDAALTLAGCNLAVIEPRAWSLPGLVRAVRRLATAPSDVPPCLKD